MHRYHDINYVMELPLTRAVKLIEIAREEDRRDVMYKLWLAMYPNFTKETFLTFDEFYEKSFPKKIEYDTRSKDELMEEILKNGGE